MVAPNVQQEAALIESLASKSLKGDKDASQALEKEWLAIEPSNKDYKAALAAQFKRDHAKNPDGPDITIANDDIYTDKGLVIHQGLVEQTFWHNGAVVQKKDDSYNYDTASLFECIVPPNSDKSGNKKSNDAPAKQPATAKPVESDDQLSNAPKEGDKLPAKNKSDRPKDIELPEGVALNIYLIKNLDLAPAMIVTCTAGEAQKQQVWEAIKKFEATKPPKAEREAVYGKLLPLVCDKKIDDAVKLLTQKTAERADLIPKPLPVQESRPAPPIAPEKEPPRPEQAPPRVVEDWRKGSGGFAMQTRSWCSDDIPKWIKDLGSSKKETVDNAKEGLAVFPRQSREALEKAIGSDDVTIAKAAKELLPQIKEKEAQENRKEVEKALLDGKGIGTDRKDAEVLAKYLYDNLSDRDKDLNGMKTAKSLLELKLSGDPKDQVKFKEQLASFSPNELAHIEFALNRLLKQTHVEVLMWSKTKCEFRKRKD